MPHAVQNIVITLLFMTFLVMASAAHAATIQLPRTGQVLCYDANGTAINCLGTGQDGDIKAGVAWSKPRFTDNGDGMVTDNLTSLVWTKDANLMKTRDPGFDNDLTFSWVNSTAGDGAVMWQHALDYVKKLNTENYLGHNDWRLPNINELRSLIDLSQMNPALPAGHPFINVQYSSTQDWIRYLSSTSFGGGAWSVDMGSGDVSVTTVSKIAPFYVWPVRGGLWDGTVPYTIPKTGQTQCYNYRGDVISCAGTGQDGDLQKGIAWPDPRFTDNSNGTVTDNLTGLNWTKDANDSGPSACAPDAVFYSWQGALDFVHCLNVNNYLGHNDWRVPNREELASLLDYQQVTPVLPAGHPFSNVGTGGNYWTSSTIAGYPNNVWFVQTDYGYLRTGFGKTDYGNSYSVWPVRGGQTYATSATTVNLTVTAVGNGTVTSAPASISCGSTCSTTISQHSATILTAAPDPGYVFTGWTGGLCSGVTTTCTISTNEENQIPTVQATFKPAMETFSGPDTPSGWTIVTTSGSPGWGFSPRNSQGNKTLGSGGFAVASSSFFSGGVTDTELRTPTYNLSTYKNAILTFKSVEYSDSVTEKLGVDISTDGGSSWNNVWLDTGQRSSHTYLGNPTIENVDISSLAAGKPSVEIRFHFHIGFAGGESYQWQIDDFALIGDSEPVTPSAAPLKGDINGDGKIDIFDALLALQYAMNLIPHDATTDAKYLAAADVAPLDPVTMKPKGDGKIDVMDALVILQRAVNLVSW